eukprot:COSAG05_NODE_29_length_29038_cov_1237.466985_27_plen_273_part_00
MQVYWSGTTAKIGRVCGRVSTCLMPSDFEATIEATIHAFARLVFDGEKRSHLSMWFFCWFWFAHCAVRVVGPVCAPPQLQNMQRARVARLETQRLREEKFAREEAASTVLEAVARRYLGKMNWRAQQAGTAQPSACMLLLFFLLCLFLMQLLLLLIRACVLMVFLCCCGHTTGARRMQRVGRGMLGRRAWHAEQTAQRKARQRLLARYEALMGCQLEEEIIAGATQRHFSGAVTARFRFACDMFFVSFAVSVICLESVRRRLRERSRIDSAT